jgi:outer membrane biosynthesis protein TonB
MSDFWRQWENQLIDGRFPLRRFLSASPHSAVFLTEYETPDIAAAIKFIRADASFRELQLARWQAAAALAHPHLIRLHGCGQCRLGSHELLFVVMEHAEQSLAQILVHRALTFDEVREMMPPALDALCFIHRSDWVHGQLKPSNVCVVDDVLKLASDVLRPAGESSVGTVDFSPYDAPEETAGGSSSAGDIWGLGMTVVAALTRYPIARRHERSEIVLPTAVTPGFAAAVRQCLSIDPARRPTAKDLEAQLAARAPSADLGPSNPAPEPPPSKAQAARVDARTSLGNIPIAYVLAGIAVLAGVVWSGVHLMHTRAPLAREAPAAEISGAASAAGAGAAGTRQAPTRVVVPAASPPAAATEARTGPVLHEEMPRVSRSALATIHGRIKVEVRVAVNEAGNVTAAALKDPGSSSYFARMAGEAAKGWRFAPSTAPQSRKWLLQFEFTRAGVKATAAAMP